MRNRKTVNNFVIKKDIVKKYNNLLDEIIEYYNIPGINLYTGICDLNTFTISNASGYLHVEIIVNIKDFIQASKFLMEYYPYLVPFFHLYSSLLSFTDITFQSSYFEQINNNIRKIRSKKSINNNVKKTHHRKI